MTSIDPITQYTEELVTKFDRDIRFSYIDEIICEERVLKEFKSLYAKHAFDAIGATFRELYGNQYELVKELKIKYAERYNA